MSSPPQAPVPSRSEKSLDDRVLAPDKERALDHQPCLIEDPEGDFLEAAYVGGYKAALAYLTRALKDPQPPIRLWALENVKELGVDVASGLVPDLLGLLDDEEDAVRMKVLSALEWLGPEAREAVRRILEVAVNDRAESTREAATRALLAIDSERVWVVPALRDTSERDRLVAELRLLGEAGRRLRHKVQSWQPVAAAREEVVAPGTGAEKEPAGTASDSGGAGRELRHKVHAWQPVAGAHEVGVPPVPGPRWGSLAAGIRPSARFVLRTGRWESRPRSATFSIGLRPAGVTEVS
jgi:HEAT repeat protein